MMSEETSFDAPDGYELDEDGFVREVVGPWVKDKYTRLARYVGISRSVRKKFIGNGKPGATYIDPFSGPGRVRLRNEKQARDGGPLVAWKMAADGKAPFSQLYIADAERHLVEAAARRLAAIDAPVETDVGLAIETIDRLIPRLNPYGLHFAFLDPYNLAALDFTIIRKLSKIQRMDILVHVSTQDLQRNLRRYAEQNPSPLDTFAPGWRDEVDLSRPDPVLRAMILQHWKGLLLAEGMTTAETFEQVVGTRNQRLYLLAFAARHERALEFWNKIRNLDRQPSFEF